MIMCRAETQRDSALTGALRAQNVCSHNVFYAKNISLLAFAQGHFRELHRGKTYSNRRVIPYFVLYLPYD